MVLYKRNNSFAVRFGHLFTFKMIIKQNSQRLIVQQTVIQTEIQRRHMCWMHMVAVLFFFRMTSIKMRLRNNKKTPCYTIKNIWLFFIRWMCRIRAEYNSTHEVFCEYFWLFFFSCPIHLKTLIVTRAPIHFISSRCFICSFLLSF